MNKIKNYSLISILLISLWAFMPGYSFAASALDEQQQWQTSAGKPIVNGFIYIGTQNADPEANPITIFSDRELTTPLANPQRTDSLGRSVNKIWIPGRYSIKVEDSNGVQIYQELDNGEGVSTGVTSLDNVLGANTITATATTTITEYVDQEQYVFTTAQVNTGAVTLNIDSIGAKSILQNHIEAISSGQFEADQVVIVVFNGTDDVFEWTNINSRLVVPSIGINFIGGGNTSTGTDTDHDIDIKVGEYRDIGNSLNMSIVATTIAIDAAAGINSISTGTVAADTPYGIWAWEDSTGVASPVSGYTFDIVTDANGSPTAPTGYDKKRLIGYRLTDSSSNLLAMRQSGDYFEYLGPAILDVSDATITGEAFETGTLSAPPNSLVEIYGALENPTAAVTNAGKLEIITKGGDTSFDNASVFGFVVNAANFDFLTLKGTVLVDGSSQIEYTAIENSGSATVKISTRGFTMFTRSDP